jgi:hypothetical protein
MKMNEIRKMAKNMKINSFGKTKVDLVREIQLKEGNFDCFGRVTDFCDQMDCCFREDCFKAAEKIRA